MLKNQYIVAENQLGKYCVPVSSSYTYTSQAILNGNVHEPDTIRFIAENSGDGHIVHAGTGFGDFLPGIANSCKATIWTFEPNQENYFCAKKTIELNKLANVNLFNVGLGKEQKKSFLRVEQNNKKLGPRCEIFESKELLQAGELESIEIVPLDSIIHQDTKVTIIHLDVEGYEQEVLSGALEIINKNSPLIILEIHKEALKYNEFMESIGYSPIKHLIYDAGPMVFVNTVYKKMAKNG
jgi:FkbM family methyltransferase